MNYTTEINEIDTTIIVTTSGDLETTETAEMGLLIRLQALDLKYKIIYDFSLSKNFISFGEAYFWFADYYDVINVNFRRIPTAIINNANDKDFFEFYENTCYNRDIQLKIFLEEASAKQWLDQFNVHPSSALPTELEKFLNVTDPLNR